MASHNDIPSMFHSKPKKHPPDFAQIPIEAECTRRLYADGHICPVSDNDGRPCGPCQEMLTLKGHILEARAVLAKNERTVEEAKRKLNILMKQHKEVVSKREGSHGSIINRRIPPEIVSTIFLFCIDDLQETKQKFTRREKPCRQALKLGAICRRWRDIAWSTPSLWKTFAVSVPHYHFFHFMPSGNPFEVELTHQWLSRSGKLPLSIFIGMTRPDYPHRGPQFGNDPHPIIEVVKEYSARWQDLYLRAWTPWIASLAVNPSQIGTLRTLSLSPEGPYLGSKHKLWDRTQMSCQRLYIYAENLGVESRERNFHRRILAKLTISWTVLVDLNLDFLSYANCHQLLKSATQLTRFKITNIHYDDGLSIPPSDLIIHSKLLYFSISAGNWSSSGPSHSIKYFLELLHLPSLKELDCHYCPTTFLARLPQLTKLSLAFSNSTEGESYIEPLKLMSSLEELHLKDTDIADGDYIRVLVDDRRRGANYDGVRRPLLERIAGTNLNLGAPHIDSSQFLPALRSFIYENVDRPPWKIVVGILGPVVALNNPHRRPLKVFRIIHGTRKDIPDDIQNHLKEARKAGIKVTLQRKTNASIV